MPYIVRNPAYDESTEPHKVYVGAVQLLLASAPPDRPYLTFDQIRAAAPPNVAAALDDGVLEQILRDLGHEVFVTDAQLPTRPQRSR